MPTKILSTALLFFALTANLSAQEGPVVPEEGIPSSGTPSAEAPSKPIEEKSIVIIIPSYNNKEWYHLNLDSILTQQYDNFRVIYFDDASTDGTGSLVTYYLLKHDLKHKVTFVQNQERVGALANIYFAVTQCKPTDIIVLVDGDDWLYHESVLQVVNKLYANPDIWLTYGQYITYPDGTGYGADPLPTWVFDHHYYRDYPWVTTHLRSFYAGLFHKVKREDLLYEGKFYPVAWDLAFMFPMLEMSGPHSHFYPGVLYVYNVQNPLNDIKQHKEFQARLEAYIRTKQRYGRLDALTFD